MTTLMHRELHESPQRLREQISQNAPEIDNICAGLVRFRPTQWFAVGRGTSDHACAFFRYLLGMQQGFVVGDLSPSLLTVYARQLALERPFILAISQSGAGRDVNEVVNQVRNVGGLALGVTNEPCSALAENADYCLALRAGSERAVAATKTFIATLCALSQFVAALSKDRALSRAVTELPAVLDTASREAHAWWAPEAFSRLASPMFVIGRGVAFSIARELALKLKEVCRIHAEAYSAAEFKHGPIAVAGARCPVLVLCLADETREGVIDLVRELDKIGAPVLLVGPALPALPDCPRVYCLATLKSATVFTDAIAAVFQLYDSIERLSVMRGLYTETPPHLNKVTSTF